MSKIKKSELLGIVREQGYTDEYRASDEYKTVKAANESLRKIRGEL